VTQSHQSPVIRRNCIAALVAAIALLVLASPASALLKGFWGPTQINGQSQFPIYRDLGVTLFQIGLNWGSVAPTRPTNPSDPNDPAYHWPADIDYAIQQASANHMRVLILLAGAPSWANGGHPANYAPIRPADFADFARAASRRYPAVRHWMIWGEPTRVPNFMPFVGQSAQQRGHALTAAQKRAPHRYARILDAAYGALKSNSAKNLVIGGNTYTTGDIPPVRWIQNLRLSNGKPPRMDLYGHNPFSYRHPSLDNEQSGPDTVDFSDLRRFDKRVARYLGRPRHKRIRLFLSEFTVPTDKPDAEFNFHVTRRLQAKWITDGFRVARQVHAYGLGWIHLYDDPSSTDGPVVQGGLIDAQGNKKPGYYAFKRG
jgi:Cellulase (glycosyl hydrolase family 5)